MTTTQPDHVTIIGGGLMGLASAMFLTERGVTVTILDVATLGSGASRGNAGFVCSTIVGPLAGPGAVRRAVTSLAHPDSALRVQPGQMIRLAPWFIKFMAACTDRRYRMAQEALGSLNQRTPAMLDELRAMGVIADESQPLLAPFHDERIAEHFLAGLAPLAQFGCAMPTGMLTGDELRARVPALTAHVNAGVELLGEHAIDPRVFVSSMIDILRGRGVEFVENCRIAGARIEKGRLVAIATDSGARPVDRCLLSAGSGSRRLGRIMGLRLPIIGGQGYNVVLPPTPDMNRAMVCEEVHSVATPFADGIRLGGTMEFGGDNPRFNQRRVDAIIRTMRQYLDLDWDAAGQQWAGLRPMSPDGLPLIGVPRGFENLVVATGHGMFGLTLTATTGAAVAELLCDGGSSVDLAPFSPDRFGR